MSQALREAFLDNFTGEVLADLDPRNLDDEQTRDLTNAVNNLGVGMLTDDQELIDMSECTIFLIAETQAQKTSAKMREIGKNVALSVIKLAIAL